MNVYVSSPAFAPPSSHLSLPLNLFTGTTHTSRPSSATFSTGMYKYTMQAYVCMHVPKPIHACVYSRVTQIRTSTQQARTHPF